VILADEPTAALDDANCEKALSLLFAQAAACQATLIVATHDRRIAARFPRRLEL
jgi:putative ABC transport system ATP-binding protein